jgi:hypothetical protein
MAHGMAGNFRCYERFSRRRRPAGDFPIVSRLQKTPGVTPA